MFLCFGWFFRVLRCVFFVCFPRNLETRYTRVRVMSSSRPKHIIKEFTKERADTWPNSNDVSVKLGAVAPTDGSVRSLYHHSIFRDS